MKSIRIEHLTKTYDGEVIFDDLSLTIPAGKFFALLGPSGCGKTTLLRLIAGFDKVDEGTIYVGDYNITHLPINERYINTVFQNYALFPHLNVFDNVAYSQVIRGIPAAQIKEKVQRILKAVNLHTHMYRPIKQLSGGQKQRVALARAIINDPRVLLLDEPLAALDVKLRERMLIELMDLQEKLKTTFLYVTHDQSEALTVADQMAIMNYDGKIEQIGTPKEMYEFPRTAFVANFVGTTNLFRGVIRGLDETPYVDVEGLGRFYVSVPSGYDWVHEGMYLLFGLRPEKILISKKPHEGFSNMVKGIVESIVYRGRSTQYNVRLKNDQLVSVFEQNEEHFEAEVIDYDDEVYLYWQRENVMLLKK